MSDKEPLQSQTPGHLSTSRHPGSTLASSRGSREKAEEFAEFYRSFASRLVGFLIWHGAPAVLAADLAQDTMIKAYQNWEKIGSPEAWARKVASRELIRHFSRVDEEPVPDVPESATPLLPRPEQAAEWEQTFDFLKLIASLPPRQRQVLAWTMAGYSSPQIAEELGITAEAVRASLRKARASITSRMKTSEAEL